MSLVFCPDQMSVLPCCTGNSGLEWLIYVIGMHDVMFTCVLHRWWIDLESSLLLKFPNGKPNPLSGLTNAWLVDVYEWESNFLTYFSYVWSKNPVDTTHSRIYCYSSMFCWRAWFHLWLVLWLFLWMDVKVVVRMRCWWLRVSIDMVKTVLGFNVFVSGACFLFLWHFRDSRAHFVMKSGISTWYLQVWPLITFSRFSLRKLCNVRSRHS